MHLFWTLVLSAIVLGLLLLLFQEHSSRYTRMPPGPTPLPLIGNMLQLNSKAPYESFMEVKKLKEKFGPVMTVHLGPIPLVVLVGFEAVHEALVQQADTFAGRAVPSLIKELSLDFGEVFFAGLLQSNGERWKQLRRFSLSTLRDFGMGRSRIEKWIQKEVKYLTEEFRKTKGSPCEPTLFLSRAVSNVICSIVFGQRFDYQDENFIKLLSLVDESLHLFSKPTSLLYNIFPALIKLIPGHFNKMSLIVNEIKQFTSAMIEKHKATLVSDSPRDFIDSFLIKMKQESNNPDSEFNYDNLNITILDLFMAGTETTSTTLRYGLLILMKYPHIQEKVQKEIDMVIGRDRAPAMADRRKMPYTDAVLHEIQRFIDLLPLNVFHMTTKDTVFRGYTIPAEHSSRYQRMPPGPTPLPLIGNMLQLNSKAFHESFMELKEKYGPVMTVHLGPMPLVVLVGFEAVHEALVQQADVFAGRAVPPLIKELSLDCGFVQSNGERWKQLRRFSLSTLRDFGMGRSRIEKWIQEEVKYLINEFRKTKEKVQKEIDAVIGRDRAPAMEDRRKMPYADAVFHEIQRFIDLLPLNVLHMTTKDTVFRGYTIPEGTMVVPMLHSVMFEKTKWATPDSFNPGHFLDENGCFRMSSSFMPFSTGKRKCAGEGLAMMELFLFFSTLLQNFSFFPTEEPANISLSPDSKLIFKILRPYKFMAIPR
ncbi:CP2G1 protein, partial [Polypterus senegalus]